MLFNFPEFLMFFPSVCLIFYPSQISACVENKRRLYKGQIVLS